MKLNIHVYTAFATSSHLYIKGRLLKNDAIVSKKSQGILSSLFYTVLRAWSKEITHTPISIRFRKSEFHIETDDEGYFYVFEQLEDPVTTQENIIIESTHKGHTHSLEHNLDVFDQEYSTGIISDIDDTAMVTGVKSFFKIKVIINTLFLNPFRRKPIQNAAEAFQALSEGLVIYLSNSPWNLYDYLKSFLNHNNFPKGIMILRDMGWKALRKKSISQMNKYKEIENLLKAFERTKFILIGDTGEYDFDIYTTVYKKHPDRIQKIIMNVAGNKSIELKIREAIRSKEYKIDIQLVDGYKGLI